MPGEKYFFSKILLRSVAWVIRRRYHTWVPPFKFLCMKSKEPLQGLNIHKNDLIYYVDHFCILYSNPKHSYKEYQSYC